MSKGIERVSTIIKGLAALIAFFPGAIILSELVDIPPTLSTLIKAISFSIGVIVLLGVFLMRDAIQKTRDNRFALLMTVAVLLGAASATTYFQFASSHIIVVETGENSEGELLKERYVKPLWPSDTILQLVAPFGGDYEEAIRMSGQAETLKQLLQENDASATAVMVLLLVLAEVLLVAPIIAAAWKLAGTPLVDGD